MPGEEGVCVTVSVSTEGWTDCAAHSVCHARGGGCVCVTVSVSTEGWTDCAAHRVCHVWGGGCVCDCVCVCRRVD